MQPDGEATTVRASNQERDSVVIALREAAGEGRLTLEELAERMEAALSATTRAELDPLTADLPADSAPAPPPGRGRQWIVGIMGGGDHKGRWRIAPRCTVVNIMGGADLDLREALVEGTVVEIVVISVMGGSDIVVPEGVRVELGGFAFMGGNDLKVSGAPVRPGAPVVRVRAYSIMGGTEVKTRPPDAPSRWRLRPPPPPPAPPL